MPFSVRVRSEAGEARFAVRESAEDLDVWALRGEPREVADALALFLNAVAGRAPAHDVRRALLPYSDLPPLDTPPSAVRPSH